MVDEYWFGTVSRVSPEAPVPVLSIERVETREGAAANVANNCRALGAPVRAVFGGGDRIRKIRAVSRNQQMMRLDYDFPQIPIKGLDYSGVSLVVFVDYGKGSLRDVRELILKAKEAGVRVLVDPKGYDYEKYRGADLIKPNLDEMRVMVGGWEDEEDLANKVQELQERAEIGAVLLTRAADGMTLYAGWGGTSLSVPARATGLVDVSGAGETALAAFAVALHEDCSLYAAMEYANKAAGIAVGRFGTTVVRREEVF
jgi:rfaE bifunctional protein kinase chain/domain